MLAADREVPDTLEGNGITENVFRARLCDEPGPSPAGEIPLTVRARMILGFARSAAAGDGGAICPRHLMKGVIAESRDWRQRGFHRRHQLEEAAAEAGTNLAEIESAILHQ